MAGTRIPPEDLPPIPDDDGYDHDTDDPEFFHYPEEVNEEEFFGENEMYRNEDGNDR